MTKEPAQYFECNGLFSSTVGLCLAEGSCLRAISAAQALLRVELSFSSADQ
jgi:hypothetical protein